MVDIPKCFKRECIYYLGVLTPDQDDERTQVPHCAAYLEGIPEDISFGDDLHKEIRDDQENNITYQKIEQ